MSPRRSRSLRESLLVKPGGRLSLQKHKHRAASAKKQCKKKKH